MRVTDLGLCGLQLITPKRFGDERGWFTETFNSSSFAAAGLPGNFAQDNQSNSRHGVLRGLHRQVRHPQGKLVRVLSGRIWDVAVDMRRSSPSYAQWFGLFLQPLTPAGDLQMLWIPEGFAHGFLVLSESADVQYKVTRPYDPQGEQTIVWNDPDLAIAWPLDQLDHSTPTLSAKDAAGLRFADAEPF